MQGSANMEVLAVPLYGASLGWYQCTVKIWIWMNRYNSNLQITERSNFAQLSLLTANRWMLLNRSKGPKHLKYQI